MSSLILKINQLPTNGYCYVAKTNGTSLTTYFDIECTNWIDPDGQIVKYEYMGIFCLLNFYKISNQIIIKLILSNFLWKYNTIDISL